MLVYSNVYKANIPPHPLLLTLFLVVVANVYHCMLLSAVKSGACGKYCILLNTSLPKSEPCDNAFADVRLSTNTKPITEMKCHSPRDRW